MRHAIDTVSRVEDIFCVTGWCVAPSGKEVKVEICVDGRPIRTVVDRIERPDVTAIMPDARKDCGFRARGILARGEKRSVGLRMRADKTVLAFENPGEQAGARLWHEGSTNALGAFLERTKKSDGAILEIGSRNRSGNVRRDWFPSLKYTGFDIVPGENVDVIGDAHCLTDYIPPDSQDFVFSISVFEHLMWPWKAALELNKILKLGGSAFIQSHQTWPCHEMPWDFFRFSRSAWAGLFCKATGFRIVESGDHMPGRIYPLADVNDPTLDFGGTYGYCLSSCFVEKIGDPEVVWDTRPNYDQVGAYPL